MTDQQLERTIQEIWEMFKETDRRFKETDRKFKETERFLKEKFAKTDQKFKETDQFLKEKFEETDRLLEEKFRKTDEKIAEVTTAIGDLGGKWGRFVEGLLEPAVKRLFSERGIPIERVHRRSESTRNGDRMEIDILAINGGYAVLIEAKSTLKVEDVNEHIERLKRFKEFFPEYAGHRVIGAVAGIVLEEDVDRYAYRQGLFVIGQSGETVQILNDEKFQPREW